MNNKTIPCSLFLNQLLLALNSIVHVWGRTKCWVTSAEESRPPGLPCSSSVQRKGNSGFLLSVLSPLPSWAATQSGGCAQLWPAVSWGRLRSRLRHHPRHLNTTSVSVTVVIRRTICSSSVPSLTHPEVDVAFSATHHQHGFVPFLSWDVGCLVTRCFSSTYGWRCMTWKQSDNS